MRRRDFIALLGGAAAPSMLWPRAARAQQANRARRLAVYMTLAEGDPEAQREFTALQQGLAALGWIEGGNFHIDTRWATADPNSTRASAAELVRLARCHLGQRH